MLVGWLLRKTNGAYRLMMGCLLLFRQQRIMSNDKTQSLFDCKWKCDDKHTDNDQTMDECEYRNCNCNLRDVIARWSYNNIMNDQNANDWLFFWSNMRTHFACWLENQSSSMDKNKYMCKCSIQLTNQTLRVFIWITRNDRESESTQFIE